MKKTIICIFLIYITSMVSFADTNPDIMINDGYIDFYDEEKKVDINPYIEDGRTLIPYYKLLELFDAGSLWDEEQQMLTAKFRDTEIKLIIDDTTIYVNDIASVIDVPSRVKDGVVYIPLRVVTETFGLEPSWEAESETVILDVDRYNAEFIEEPLIILNASEYFIPRTFFETDLLKHKSGMTILFSEKKGSLNETYGLYLDSIGIADPGISITEIMGQKVYYISYKDDNNQKYKVYFVEKEDSILFINVANEQEGISKQYIETFLD